MRPRGTDSGFDAGDSAFAVVGDPDRGIADGDGAGFGADLDRGAAALAAFEVDPGHRVLSRAGDPDGAVAGVDPTRLLADFDRVAEHGVDRGGDLGHAVGTAVGDPDEGVGGGGSGGGRGSVRGVPRPIGRPLPVEALLPQRPPCPPASRSGCACGGRPRRRIRPPLAATALTPAPSYSAPPTAPPPTP